MKYAVTGASGQLGRLVLDEMLQKVPAGDVVAIVRDPSKLADFAAKGIDVRQADYDDPASLDAALAGVDRLLLISGNAVGQRERQHGNVINAAKKAGVSYLAYTSILHADSSKLALAPEHVATEKLLAASGLNYDLLRHGWYMENYTGNLAPSIASGAILGASGEGRVSPATRRDLAAGDAAALVGGKGGDVYECAGDESFTMAELAAEVSAASGKPVAFQNMEEADYAKVLEGVGLPPPVAAMLASTSKLTTQGELEDHSNDLSRLSGRPTTRVADAVRASLG
jgi:NAD(P)H dehydrogenase (quinone)